MRRESMRKSEVNQTARGGGGGGGGGLKQGGGLISGSQPVLINLIRKISNGGTKCVPPIIAWKDTSCPAAHPEICFEGRNEKAILFHESDRPRVGLLYFRGKSKATNWTQKLQRFDVQAENIAHPLCWGLGVDACRVIRKVLGVRVPSKE